MILMGLMGLIGSGKGAVSEYLVQKKDFHRLSFADPVKDAAAGIFGWDRALLQGDTDASRAWREQKDVFWSKHLERPFSPRIALQEIGTEVGRNYFHPDIWLASLENRFNTLKANGQSHFVIDDCRFQNEIELITRLGGKLFVIERGPRPDWWETAYNQNSDLPNAFRMEQKFKSIHPSEWKWISKSTYTNSELIQNNGTVEEIQQVIDNALALL